MVPFPMHQAGIRSRSRALDESFFEGFGVSVACSRSEGKGEAGCNESSDGDKLSGRFEWVGVFNADDD